MRSLMLPAALVLLASVMPPASADTAPFYCTQDEMGVGLGGDEGFEVGCWTAGLDGCLSGWPSCYVCVSNGCVCVRGATCVLGLRH